MIAYILPSAAASDAAARATEIERLRALAEDFSPRVECDARGVALDASGLSRLFGTSGALAREIARQASGAIVAIAPTRTAAAMAAHQLLEGAKGEKREWAVVSDLSELAGFPLRRLNDIEDFLGPALARVTTNAPKRRSRGQGRHYRLAPAPDHQITRSPLHQIHQLHRWGLETLGDLIALPANELSARLGDAGLVLQRAARGEDERPLVPAAAPVSFMQSLQLEWPIEDLQPLSFVVARLCESLEQALARADRGAISLTTLLRLTTKEAYARTLTLPAPMRDARVLRTLVMLDLETHPPPAAIDEVVLDVDVAPGRVLQTELFEPAIPAPETLSTLVARLSAIAGESRVGAPGLVDTHRPGAFAMKAFAPHKARDQRPETRGMGENSRPSVVEADSGLRPMASGLWPVSVIRRFRPPRPARVRMGVSGPVHVDAEEISGAIAVAAGPWRTSGGWWERAWDHDEWDVALANGLTCRLSQDRETQSWAVEGILD